MQEGDSRVALALEMWSGATVLANYCARASQRTNEREWTLICSLASLAFAAANAAAALLATAACHSLSSVGRNIVRQLRSVTPQLLEAAAAPTVLNIACFV